MVHKIGNEKEEQILNELREKGIKVYSISRVNTFNTCSYEYYQTYVARKKGEDNCYSLLGSWTHEMIEDSYRSNLLPNKKDLISDFNVQMFELEIKDVDFPNDTIKNAFTKDMQHFLNNFKLLDGEFTLEKMYIAQFGEYYLYGYIDAIRNHDTLDILDWKTSSKFSGSKLTDAGRQLIVYKLGLEQSGLKIDKVMWNMLKYIYVCHKQKNGKIKQKMVNRGKLIKEMKSAFEKEMLASGMNEIDVMLTLDKAEESNDFDSLPQVIKDKYWLEDCLLEYEVTDGRVEEVKAYITNTIKEIESMDFEDEAAWKPLNIDKENFYCNTLCNHRNHCKYLKEWKKNNPFKKIGF